MRLHPHARAVLFDVGGPLDMEVEHERHVDRDIRAALAAEGIAVDDAAYAAACRWAVECYAWDTYQAIIWRLTGGDVEQSLRLRGLASHSGHRRDLFEPRPGMRELLAWLHSAGVRLGLAANQPARAVEKLDRAGMGQYFHHRQVSGIHGFNKPDVRLFLTACADLGVEPAETVMVGDRIDNDIAPAKWLGMRAVHFRTGRHLEQIPRSPSELPDAVVTDVPGLAAALRAMLGIGKLPDLSVAIGGSATAAKG